MKIYFLNSQYLLNFKDIIQYFKKKFYHLMNPNSHHLNSTFLKLIIIYFNRDMIYLINKI